MLSLTPLKNDFLKQAGKYFIVGGICTLLDILLLFLGVHFVGLNYLISSIISFVSAAVLNYYLCTLWIFSIRVVKKRHQEFIYYAIITGFGLVLSTFLIWIFTEFGDLYFLISKVFAASITYWWGFGARRYFLHTLRKGKT